MREVEGEEFAIELKGILSSVTQKLLLDVFLAVEPEASTLGSLPCPQMSMPNRVLKTELRF